MLPLIRLQHTFIETNVISKIEFLFKNLINITKIKLVDKNKKEKLRLCEKWSPSVSLVDKIVPKEQWIIILENYIIPKKYQFQIIYVLNKKENHLKAANKDASSVCLISKTICLESWCMHFDRHRERTQI